MRKCTKDSYKLTVPVTICSSADFLSFFLKQKSPSALDKAKLPTGQHTQTNSIPPIKMDLSTETQNNNSIQSIYHLLC